MSSGKQQTLNNLCLNIEIQATTIQHSKFSQQVWEKRQVLKYLLNTRSWPCSGKGKKSYCQELTLGKHMSRTHLFILIHQLKCHCRNRADLSGVSLLYKWANTPLHWLELMGAPGAYSSALHCLSATKSLEKCARSQNPCGTARSNHWNCVHLPTASHNFTDFCVLRLCWFYQCWLNYALSIILFIIHVSANRIHQLLETHHCRGYWHSSYVRNVPLFPSNRSLLHWCGLFCLNPLIIDLQLKTSNELFYLIWTIFCSLLMLLMIALCGLLGLSEDPSRKGIPLTGEK